MNLDNIWLDPLYLDDLLDEEELSIRKTTHDYCNKNLLPIVVTPLRLTWMLIIMVKWKF